MPGGVFRYIVESSAPGAVLARRVVPLAFAALPLVAWLGLWGERAGWYAMETGLALMVMASLLLLAAVVWRAALIADRAHHERAVTVEALVEVNATLERRMGEHTQDLLEAREMTSFLAENSSDAMFRVDPGRRITHATPAVSIVLGIAGADVLGWPLAALVDDSHDAALQRSVDEAVRYGTAEPVEILASTAAAGRQVWVELTVRSIPVVVGEDVVAELHVTMRDIEERRAGQTVLADNEARLRSLVEGVPVGVFEADHAGRCTFVSERLCQIAGLADGSGMLGAPWLCVTHPEDRNSADDEWRAAVAAGQPFERSLRVLTPDGRTIWVYAAVHPVVRDGHASTSYVGTITDESMRRQLEQDHQVANQMFRAVFDTSPIGMMMATLEGERTGIVNANDAYCRITARTREEIATIDPYSITDPEFLPEARKGRAELLAGNIDSHHMELRQLDGRGAWQWVSLSRSVIRADDGTAKFMLALVESIDDRKALEGEQIRLATTDPLTGLANRRRFLDRLGGVGGEQNRLGNIAIIYIDLDHFKTVNDALGHEAGDEVLRTVGRLLESAVRPTDTVARLGGDEFSIMMEDVALPDLQNIIDRLNQAIDIVQTLPDGSVHHVTASIGVSVGPASCPAEVLLGRADRAMYAAKHGGRHGSVIDTSADGWKSS